jgi:hypothetical protein
MVALNRFLDRWIAVGVVLYTLIMGGLLGTVLFIAASG